MSYSISRLGGEAVALAEQLHGVYVEAFAADGPEAAAHWRDETLPTHATRPGFRLVLAQSPEIVGFGYGYTGEPGQWWTDRVARLVPAAQLDGWLGGHFEVVELAVRPAHQRRGIGAALMDCLLAGLPHRAALLSTYRHDTPARRLYLRQGWQVLVDALDGDSSLLGKQLPGR